MRSVPGFSRVRASNLDRGERQQRQSSGYQQWLRKKLNTPVTLPTMQLIAGGQYYSLLDSAIEECLTKNTDPQATLDAVDAGWRKLTDQIGTKTQTSAWRRAQA